MHEPFGWRTLIVSVVLLAVAASATPMAAEEFGEEQIKAAFLYNFAKFFEWPPGTFASASSPIVIGVVGNHGFARILEDAVKGKWVNGRSLSVRTLDSAAQWQQCQVLYLDTLSKTGQELLAQVRYASVLTVGNSEEFVQAGGIIGFVLENAHMRFALNPDAAQRANLRASSQLLSLALLTRDKPR